MGCTDRRLRSHPALLAVCVGGPALEAAVLAAIGRHDALALAPQVTAVAPFGAFHDVRWLLAYHPSWWAFAAELTLLVVFRGAVTATTVLTAWPRGHARPGFGAAFRRGTAFTIGALLVLAPWSLLLFGMGAIPLSWLFFAAVPPALLVATLVHRGAIVGEWWHLPTRRTAVWTLSSFVVLTLAGLATVAAPPALAGATAAAAGLFNAWAWFSIVHGIVCDAEEASRVPLAPVAVALAMVGIVGAAALAFALFTVPTPEATGGPVDLVEEPGAPLLVARGFGTGWAEEPRRLLGAGFNEVRFSYRGISPDGRPLPYDADDTHRPLGELAALMARQVEVLHRQTGQPVSILAVSEGTFVTKLYLLAVDDPPVDRVVLMSPLLRPAQVYYPPAGRDGWGVASGYGLRGVTQLINWISPFELAADSPFVRSVVDHAPTMRPLYGCRAHPDVEEHLVVPLDTALATPAGLELEVPVTVLPGFHAELLERTGNPRIRALFDGRRPDGYPWAASANGVIRLAAAAWQVPSVPVQLPPAWDLPDDVGLRPDGLPPCDAVRRLISARIDLDGPTAG